MNFIKGFLSSFRSEPDQPERRKDIKSGVFWRLPGHPAFRAGKGYNQDVVGESFYRSSLERLVGGATAQGVNVSKPVELRAGQYDGKPSIEVWIEGERCGSIPKNESQSLISEIDSLGVRSGTAKGRISAGFEGGDYSVKLSLSRPLKLI